MRHLTFIALGFLLSCTSSAPVAVPAPLRSVSADSVTCAPDGAACESALDCCDDAPYCGTAYGVGPTTCRALCGIASQGCVGDADCCFGNACIGAVCEPSSGTSCANPGQACGGDCDCCPGLSCELGACSSPGTCAGQGQFCDDARTCCGGLACEGSVCIALTVCAGDGQACGGSRLCCTGFTCRDSTCEP